MIVQLIATAIPPPDQPLTLWAVLGLAMLVVTIGLPTLLQLRQLRTGRDEDAVRQLALHLDAERIVAKVRAIVAPSISASIAAHDQAQNAHNEALKKVPTLEQFNNAMQLIRIELQGMKDLIQASEQRRTDEIVNIRVAIEKSEQDRRREFDLLRSDIGCPVRRSEN